MIPKPVVPTTLVTLLLSLIILTTGVGQVIRTDSVNLVSLISTKVTKVASKTDRTKRLAMAWQTYNADSTRLYFRLYSQKGTPIGETLYLARSVNKVGWVVMDFDVAIRNNGETVVAWSEFVPTTNKFNHKYCLFDLTGKAKGAPKNLAVGNPIPYLKTAANGIGGFLTAWDDISGWTLVQLFNEQGVAEGSPLQLDIDNIIAQAGIIEYTDEKRIHVGTMFKDWSSAPSAVVRAYDHLGSLLNNPPTSSNVWSVTTGDVSFGNKKTVFSFAYNSATYFTMTSKVSASTANNRILVDNVAAQFSQVAQNDNGSFGMAWATTSDVRMGIFHSSGQKTGTPIVVPTAGLTPSSIDVMSGAGSEAAVVVAGNSDTTAQITLQRFRYQGPTETEEEVIKSVIAAPLKFQYALSGVRTHVAVWQHKEPTRSAIFAQVYDSLFQKKGDAINVTGFISHGELYYSYLFDFESAIDSVGNFMVVWQTNNKDVRAKQFYPEGTVKRPEFAVNTGAGDIAMPARIAASPNGKFVIFWRDINGKLKARLFDKEADSGEKILKEYVWYGEYYGQYRSKNRVAINNRGDFVCTFRTDYYAVQMLIFNATLAEVASPLHSNLMYTDSNYDIVINNHQIVMSWAVDGLETGIKVQRFDTRGAKIGTLVTADDNVDDLRYPSLAMNHNNEFVLAYQDDTQQLQRFSSQGVMVGERRRFTTLGEISEVRISQNPRGDVFAVYSSDGHAVPGTNTGDYNVIAKGLFSASTAPKVYNVTRTIYEGESFDFGNDKLTLPGEYSHLFGTDSLVVLTLEVTDQVIKKTQTISFDGPLVLVVGASFPLQAVASSGLVVAYETSNAAVAQIVDGVVTAVGEGVVTITAKQPGNDTFAAAEPVTLTITVTFVTAVESSITGNATSLYPNPATNQVTLALNGFSPGTPVNIRIADAKGTIVHRSSVPANEAATVNVENFVVGLYAVHLDQGTIHIGRRFVKR
jgi:hypothetical protein